MGIFNYIREWRSSVVGEVETREVESCEEERSDATPLHDDTIWLEGDGHRKQRITSEERALTLSAVWACVQIISGQVAILPVHLFERDGRNRERVEEHPAQEVLWRPNEYTTWVDMIQTFLIHVLLWGNGYLRITRDKYHRPIKLTLIHPSKVEPVMSPNDVLFYYVSGEMVDYDDVIHIKGLSTNGYKGKSAIRVHRDNLNLSVDAQDYGEKFFSQGGNMGGVYMMPKRMTEDEYQRLQQSLIARTTGMGNAHKPLVLENGLTYERMSIPPEDAQFLGTRKFQKTEIATIFGVPPHKIADLDRATNNNIEHQGMEFVSDCLMPYIVRMEQEFRHKLLRDDEQRRYYFKFGVGALLRGDSLTRSGYYKNMVYIGAMSANEVRRLEDMNSYAEGDTYFSPSNMLAVENAVETIKQ